MWEFTQRGSYAAFLVALAVTPAATATPWPNELGRSPPNILLVNLDDAGYGDLAANEGSRLGNSTPHFDRLANESLTAYRLPRGASVCSPSRASLLTGRWAIQFGMTHAIMHGDGPSLPHAEQTIAEVLKAAGFADGHGGQVAPRQRGCKPSVDARLRRSTHSALDDGHGLLRAVAVPLRPRTLEHGTLSVGNAQMRAEFVATLASMCRIGTMPQAGLPLPQHWAKVKGDPQAEQLCPPRSLAHCGANASAQRYPVAAWSSKYVKKSEERFERIARSDHIPGKHALSTALTWTNASCSGLGSCAPLTVEQPAAPWRLSTKYADNRLTTSGSADRTPSDAQRAAGLVARPFFFYLAPIQPHGPWLPAPWATTSERFERSQNSLCGLPRHDG